MSQPFAELLENAFTTSKSLLMVGLDPEPKRFHARFADEEVGFTDFCCEIVDATAKYSCGFKPNFAHFAARGYFSSLKKVIAYIKEKHPDKVVVLDVKRGDIGSTAEFYAEESFKWFNADGATVNPYLGFDAVKPFINYKDKGSFVLCRTSNPSAVEFQNLILSITEEPVYIKLARTIVNNWNENKNLGLVVGATAPEELAIIRQIAGDDVPILLPGVGAQGGDLKTCLAVGRNSRGTGLLVSVSRAVMYAFEKNVELSVGEAAEIAAKELFNEMQQYHF